MANKTFDPKTTPIIVVHGNQGRVVIGQPARVISVNNLTRHEASDLSDLNGAWITTTVNPDRFDEHVLNRILRSPLGVVDMRSLRDWMVHKHTDEGGAHNAAIDYMEELDHSVDLDADFVDQAIDRSLAFWETCGLLSDHGPDTWALTKIGRVLKEMDFGSTPVIEIQ